VDVAVEFAELGAQDQIATRPRRLDGHAVVADGVQDQRRTGDRRDVDAVAGAGVADRRWRRIQRSGVEGWRWRRGVQRRVMLEDEPFDATQLAARVETELLTQDRAGTAARREGVGLALTPVEGDHEMGPQPFPEGMFAHEQLELSNQLTTAAGGEVGADPGLEGGQILLAQTHRLAGQPGVRGDASQWFTSPLRHRLTQAVSGAVDQPGPQGVLTGAHQRPESADVNGVGVNAKQIAGRLGDDQIGAQRAAQVRHVGLQRLAPGRRRSVAPQHIDEHIGADDTTRVQGQRGQQRAFLGGGDHNVA
jgi:hypothetical protein